MLVKLVRRNEERGSSSNNSWELWSSGGGGGGRGQLGTGETSLPDLYLEINVSRWEAKQMLLCAKHQATDVNYESITSAGAAWQVKTFFFVVEIEEGGKVEKNLCRPLLHAVWTQVEIRGENERLGRRETDRSSQRESTKPLELICYPVL